ncbi:MAG: class I SAM-dependent methyltransferase [Sedimentisphaerales bacterium]|nr:class I SAM-dependent methyltransferase [Sedimentisphaerales bacterium]
MNKDDIAAGNLRIYSKSVDAYRRYDLSRPEQAILSALKGRWHNARMLDIGVGAGRTSYTFSAIVEEYVGIDYSEAMISECKRTIGEGQSVSFHTCDASDLSQFYGRKFAFVLFSQNGIDSVDHGTRTRILSEVKKVLDTDGYFCFSSHSLRAFFPIRKTISPFAIKRPIRSTVGICKDIVFLMRKKWLYRNADIDGITAAQWKILITGDHNFQMQVYHVCPEYQVQQLRDVGFEVKAVYDREGRIVDPSTNNTSEYLHYLCQAI